MSLFPDLFKIKIVDVDNRPVSNIAVMIRLFTNHKNDYYLIPSISNEEGIIEVEREWMNKQINDTRDFFIMDYVSTIEDCKSKIEIKVMDKNEVINAIEGRKLYKDFMNIPEKDIENLLKSINYKYFPITKLAELQVQKIEEIELSIKEI
ncbi:MAG: hypothetical protein WBL93_02205 [Lutisporaceae bacterium]